MTGQKQLYVFSELTKFIELVFIKIELFIFDSVTRLQRRIYGANLALHYFITTHWVFKNAKFLALNDIIHPVDNEDFRFDRFVTGDIRKYFIACMYGTLNHHIFHEFNERFM